MPAPYSLPSPSTSQAATVGALNRQFGAPNVALLRKLALAEHLNDIPMAQRLHEQNTVVSMVLVQYMNEHKLISGDDSDVNRACRRKLVEIFIKG